MRYALNVLFLFIVAISFLSCGYRPSAKVARNIMGDSISTTIKISLQDPQNTVQIKDALDSAILEIFHTSLKPKTQAKTHLDIEMKSIEYVPLAFDAKGFITAYRSKTILFIYKTKNGKTKMYKSYGTYDFSIVANAVLTDNERYNAIKYGAKKAIRSFMAQVTSQGVGSL